MSRRRHNRSLRAFHELDPERREQAIVSYLALLFDRLETRHRTRGWVEVLGRDAKGARFVVRFCTRWTQLEAIDVQITAALRDAQLAQGALVISLGTVGIGAKLAAQHLGVEIAERDRFVAAVVRKT